MLYYLHIPKSAGTSVRELFQQVYGKKLVEVYGRMEPAYVESLKPLCHKDSVLFGHYSFSLHVRMGDPEPQYMTILRNPIDRVVSWYKGKIRDPKEQHAERILRDRLTLAEAIELGFAPELNNHSVRVLTGRGRRPILKLKHRALNVYSSRLRGKQIYQYNAQRYLDTAIANLNRYFCFVGIVERMDQLTQFMAERGDLTGADAIMPRANVAPPQDVKIDSQTLEVIRKANELDMALYEMVAGKLRAGESWYPLQPLSRSLLRRVAVSRLSIPGPGIARGVSP